jgi:hypothetical protein
MTSTAGAGGAWRRPGQNRLPRAVVQAEMLKALSATCAALAALAACAPAHAGIVFDGRWRSPGLDHWDATLVLKPGNRNRLAYVASPRWDGSRYVASLRVGGNAESERIVFVKRVFADADGRDDWWAWSIFIPRDSHNPNAIYAVSLFSKFNASICGLRGPANSLFVVNPNPRRPADRWRYMIAGGKGACTVSEVGIPGLRVVRGRWIDFSCHFRWSSAPAGDPQTGISTCYYRVEPRRSWTLAFDAKAPNLVSSLDAAGSLTIHYGLYKPESRPYAHLELGGLVVADTRSEAERAAFGPASPPRARTSTSTGHRRAPVIVAVAIVALMIGLARVLYVTTVRQ